ncbi:MAG: MerR family transcriptional regulator [Alistipes sp.]|nr:MerR family transcriptional regulator [Alistipes sp.]
MADKIYYSMGEVAEMFDVNQSLIRHWESKFDCLRPHKNKRGNRMFTADDVEKLKQIYHLVKERGMTLEGARKVMRGASGKELARETELLERLQRIRSALVEVREELKMGDDEQIVDSVGAESRDIEETVVAKVAQKEPKVETVAVKDEPQQVVVEEPQAESPQTEPQQMAENESEPNAENVAEPETEQPAKKRVRRRKKSDDDNKELFPFYEQSLF